GQDHPRLRLRDPQRPGQAGRQTQAIPDAQPVNAMALSAEQICWVANLARLELTAAELAVMTGQLNRIVEYVDQLQSLNTDGVEPLAHPLDLANVFRADEPQPSLSA